MNGKKINLFLNSAGVAVFLTAVAKLVSSAGSARVLLNQDPIFGITFQHVFWIVGGIELVIAMVCIFGKRIEIRTVLVAWLATSFLVYRIGLALVGYQKPCSCLGSLTGALHISPQTADTAMKIILAYLLIGSYASLFWLWQQRRKAEIRTQSDEIKPAGSFGTGVGD